MNFFHLASILSFRDDATKKSEREWAKPSLLILSPAMREYGLGKKPQKFGSSRQLLPGVQIAWNLRQQRCRGIFRRKSRQIFIVKSIIIRNLMNMINLIKEKEFMTFKLCPA